MKEKLGDASALSWVALVSAGGLVSFAYSAYYQSLIREFSKFFDEHVESVPENIESVNNKISNWGNFVLSISYGIFILFYFAKWDLSASTVLISVLYFFSMFFKLHTFNIFIILNAKKQVGFDKFLLFFGSFICLFLSLLSLYVMPCVEYLAFASLISSAFVYLLAKRKFNKTINGLLKLNGISIQLDFSEKILILLLNLGGYLKLNTDVLISSYVLTESDSLQYAFWVKIFYMLVSLIGLWSQIRFPFWSTGANSLLKHFWEIKIVLILLILMQGGIFLFYLFGANLNVYYFKDFFGIDILVISLVFISVFFAGATYAMDQLLMSQKTYAYLWYAIIVSFLAPVIAFSFAKMWGGLSFLVGYILVHFLLFVIDLFRIKRLRENLNQNLFIV